MTLVGDAAGYVTKCSGEGIYFAAKSGRMAGEAIVKYSEGGKKMTGGGPSGLGLAGVQGKQGGGGGWHRHVPVWAKRRAGFKSATQVQRQQQPACSGESLVPQCAAHLLSCRPYLLILSSPLPRLSSLVFRRACAARLPGRV